MAAKARRSARARTPARTPAGGKAPGKAGVARVVPCLTFQDRAEEAVRFYVSVFRDSRILRLIRAGPGQPVPEGKLLHASFVLQGREFTAFDGGPHFTFSQAFSMVAACRTQGEVDELWERLGEGGQRGPCGWLTDRFGVSWQVVPEALLDMLADPRGGDVDALLQAMLGMDKMDLAGLRRAYRGR